MSTDVSPVLLARPTAPQGMRKNGPFLAFKQHIQRLIQLAGKQWHEPKKAFRIKAGNSTYEKRAAERQATAKVKAKETEMKQEKEAERQVQIAPTTPYSSGCLS